MTIGHASYQTTDECIGLAMVGFKDEDETLGARLWGVREPGTVAARLTKSAKS